MNEVHNGHEQERGQPHEREIDHLEEEFAEIDRQAAAKIRVIETISRVCQTYVQSIIDKRGPFNAQLFEALTNVVKKVEVTGIADLRELITTTCEESDCGPVATELLAILDRELLATPDES